MNATTVAVDLAKNVFQLVVAHDDWKPVESHWLTRRQFESFFNNRAVSLVIMEVTCSRLSVSLDFGGSPYKGLGITAYNK